MANRYDGARQQRGQAMVDADIKIGIVLKNMEDGPLKVHLLFGAENLATWGDFRRKVTEFKQAQQAASGVDHTPMEISALNKDIECYKCGKRGHRAVECRSGGSGHGGHGHPPPHPQHHGQHRLHRDGGKGGKGKGGKGKGGKGKDGKGK